MPAASSDSGALNRRRLRQRTVDERKPGADHPPAEHADRLPGESPFFKRVDLQLHRMRLLAGAGGVVGPIASPMSSRVTPTWVRQRIQKESAKTQALASGGAGGMKWRTWEILGKTVIGGRQTAKGQNVAVARVVGTTLSLIFSPPRTQRAPRGRDSVYAVPLTPSHVEAIDQARPCPEAKRFVRLCG